MRRIAALLCLILPACSTPRDAFDVGERSLLAQDLPGALVAFDTVPVSHERYPEARAAAMTVERRMRRGHELLLQALLLRGEWRDEEALAVLHQASAIWPRMPGVDSLVLATEHRVKLIHEEPTIGSAPKPFQVPMLTPEAQMPTDQNPTDQNPTDQIRSAHMPAAPLGETAAAPTIDTAEVVGPKPARNVPATSGDDPVALGLVAVESRLGRGDLEAAVAELIELSRGYPDDTRVRLRLARVLHQRALQRYGQGQVAGAVVDWERVVALDPSNAVAKSLLAAARAELEPVLPPK